MPRNYSAESRILKDMSVHAVICESLSVECVRDRLVPVWSVAGQLGADGTFVYVHKTWSGCRLANCR